MKGARLISTKKCGVSQLFVLSLFNRQIKNSKKMRLENIEIQKKIQIHTGRITPQVLKCRWNCQPVKNKL